MLPRVIHAVIFDLDGTLVHSLPGLAGSLNRVLKNNGLPTHPESSVRTFIGNGIFKLIERAVPNHFNYEKITALVQQMSEDYATTWKQGTTPYPGIPETLQNLLDQNIRTAVCSNKPHQFCREMTGSLFPEITFSSVIGQRNGVPPKPDPVSALEIANSLATPPHQVAFLGDSTIDLITARNAGMISIAATWGYHDLPALESEQPSHQINSIQELLPIIHHAA